MKRAMRLPRLILLLAVGALSAGCGPSGPPTYPVTGTVTWKKAPLPDGHIIFYAEDNQTRPAAEKIKDGKFEFRATAGKKRVEILANREKPGQTNVVMGMREKEQYIPAKYNSATTLSVEVKSDGTNHFEFPLVD